MIDFANKVLLALFENISFCDITLIELKYYKKSVSL